MLGNNGTCLQQCVFVNGSNPASVRSNGGVEAAASCSTSLLSLDWRFEPNRQPMWRGQGTE